MPRTTPARIAALERQVVPIEATRVKNFAKFFKNYMSVSAVIAAALPIPVTAFKLIPTYKAQTSLLSTYTSLFCFLLLGFIFYSRHTLGRLMFPEVFGKTKAPADELPAPRFFTSSFLVGILPAQLIALSLVCVFFYHAGLDASLVQLIAPATTAQSLFADTAAALQGAQSWQIPNTLMLLYLGIFLSAESAFIIMALKEYLQDLIKLSDFDLISSHNQKATADADVSAEELTKPSPPGP